MGATMIILEQLGGNRFLAMTGAKNLVRSGDTTLQFSLPRGTANKANKVRIELDANDLYTVSFFNIRGVNVKVIETVEGVFAEDLRRVFTDRTGFYCTLNQAA